jgi:hypothetical protein
MDADTPEMGDVWKIVSRELRRKHQSWAELGRAIGVTDQTIHNWKARNKVPPSRHLDIAGFLGWTVEQVTGHAPEPTKTTPAPAPEPVYTKRANDIARMFDELKDPEVRQKAYAGVQAILQMAKAGQHLPEPTPPATPTTEPPAQKSRRPAHAPKTTPHRGR